MILKARIARRKHSACHCGPDSDRPRPEGGALAHAIIAATVVPDFVSGIIYAPLSPCYGLAWLAPFRLGPPSERGTLDALGARQSRDNAGSRHDRYIAEHSYQSVLKQLPMVERGREEGREGGCVLSNIACILFWTFPKAWGWLNI